MSYSYYSALIDEDCRKGYELHRGKGFKSAASKRWYGVMPCWYAFVFVWWCKWWHKKDHTEGMPSVVGNVRYYPVYCQRCNCRHERRVK